MPTIFIAVATGVQAYIYCQQTGQMKRGISVAIRQERIANKSAIAAKESAMLAKRSTDVLANIERAWMVLDTFGPPEIVSGEQLYFKFSFKNAGRTPAWPTEISHRFVYAHTAVSDFSAILGERMALPREAVAPDGPYRPRPSLLMVPYAEKLGVISADQLALINQDKAFLYFIGELVYDTVIEKGRKTPFCYLYQSPFMFGPHVSGWRPIGGSAFNQET